MIDLFKTYVLDQWRMILTTAPVPFFMSLLVIAALLWFVAVWGYGRENSLLRQQVADYKDRLNGATPDQAKAKIDDLEKRVKETIGSRWEPLSKEEASRLSEPASRI